MNRKIQKIEAVTTLPKRLHVAAYARVSLGTEHMLHSLAAQVSHYSKYIQSRTDWEYAGVYADADETGTRDDRPEFQRLLTDCREGKINRVITKSISRFARNTVTLLETVRELKSLGIGVWFEEQNIDTLSSDGELMLTIVAGFAQEESRSVSENIKWRKRNNMKNGKAKATKIFGYSSDGGKLVIVPEEAEIVRVMFEECLGGLGQEGIANKLNALGIKSPEGCDWCSSTVRRILTNPKMYGDLLHQSRYVKDHITKKQVRNHGELPMYLVENTHDGIVSKETFEAVQAELTRRGKVGGLNEYDGLPFRKMLTCGICGLKFVHGTNGQKWWKQPSWRCGGRDKRRGVECNMKEIPEDILMTVTAEVLRLAEFDGEVLKEEITEIKVPEHRVLIFVFKDGTEVRKEWQKKSNGPNSKYDRRRHTDA